MTYSIIIRYSVKKTKKQQQNWYYKIKLFNYFYCFTELPSSQNQELQTESSSENEETKLEWFKPATSEELSSFLESEDWLRYVLGLSKR